MLDMGQRDPLGNYGLYMDTTEYNNLFSRNLLSLELQLKTLLAGAGGEQTTELLDGLSRLSGTEQKIALGVFQRVLRRVLDGEKRVASADDKALREFEDSLFEDIESGITLETARLEKNLRLLVLQGGRKKASQTANKPVQVDFEARRRKMTLY